jgi:hypothetical protein
MAPRGLGAIAPRCPGAKAPRGLGAMAPRGLGEKQDYVSRFSANPPA